MVITNEYWLSHAICYIRMSGSHEPKKGWETLLQRELQWYDCCVTKPVKSCRYFVNPSVGYAFSKLIDLKK